MMNRLRQRHAHDAKRSGRGAQPCMMHHVDDDADSPAFLPHKLRISAMIFDLGRCVGAVAQLVLEPHQVDGVALPIGRDARREEAGKRSEEHTSELQSLMRTSSAVFCLKKKKDTRATTTSIRPLTRLQ